jgi:arylsulfatase A-like enzyme/tetratricopeptide (TPR) repeat protein
VGCYGWGGGSTPTLDRLAREGTRFQHAISPAPLTLPSHATLLTGLDPPAHGVRDNGDFRLEADIPTLTDRFRAAGFGTGAFVAAAVLDERHGLARSFDVYDDELGMARAGRAAMVVASRPANQVVDSAIRWLDGAPERFFSWIHLYDPHQDLTPPEPWASRFESDLYDGEIAFADAELARLLAAIDERFPDGATAVVVTSDHGEARGDHGEWTHSFTIYDPTQRVPLILSGPGIPADEVVEDQVALADLAPTVLDWFGLPPMPASDGTSLWPALQGRALPSDRVAWVETLASQLDLGWSPQLGVRTAEWKYIRVTRPELYDLQSDPGELRNLADEQPERVRALDAVVEARIAAGRPPAPNLEVGDAERARLEALGYIDVAEAEGGGPPLGVVGGPDPKDKVFLLQALHRANVLLSQGRGREVLEALKPFGPSGSNIEGMRVDAALMAGDTGTARAHLERLRGSHPEDVFLLEGRLALAEGRTQEAIATFRAAAKKNPGRGSGFVLLGEALELVGDREEARRSYEQAAAAEQPNSTSLWRLAALDTEDGDLMSARRRLAELPPGHLSREAAALRLARAELVAGRLDMARMRLSAAERAGATTDRIFLASAEVLDRLGRQGEAAVAAERALAFNPDNVLAKNHLAWLLSRLGRRLDRAESLAREVVEVTDGTAGALETLASVQVAQGAFAAALETAERGLVRAPGRYDLLYRRAEAYAGLGRELEAEQALAEARAAPAGDGTSHLREEAEKRFARLSER